MNSHKVFVYGTLKSGEPNHHLFSSKNGFFKYIGKAFTVEKYPLIIATKYNIPMLLLKPGSGHRIEGEVYEVDDKMLLKLDELEDHPNYYVRTVHPVSLTNDSTGETSSIDCWIYFIEKFNTNLLDQPTFPSYSSSGDHNLPYLDSYNESTVEDLLKDVLAN